MSRFIYADNAATTRMSKNACEAMVRFMSVDFANASQPYSFARAPKKAIKEARKIIADCIGAEPEEIYFTSCGTESDNWVIKSTKSNIITSSIEHHAVLNSCKAAAGYGRNTIYLPVTNEGLVESKDLDNNLDDTVGLVSVMFANNEIGTVQHIKDLAEIAHRSNILFHTDAVQAVGHVDINVKNIDVDFLSASAHKFNGPKGIGFLYIKNGIKLSPLIDGGSQELGHRAGTENVAAIVAMAIALKDNCDAISANSQYLRRLETLLIERLDNAQIDFKRNGINQLPGNISLSFRNTSGEALLHRLDLMGICVSTGSACDSKDTQISHVLKAINLEEDYALGTIRISLCKDNTEEEIRIIADALIKILT